MSKFTNPQERRRRSLALDRRNTYGENDTSSQWQQAGKISLWYYLENVRNFPGWHLNADTAGCNALIALLDQLLVGEPAAYLLDIVSPSPAQLTVPNNKSGQAAWLAPNKLHICFTGNTGDWLFSLPGAETALEPTLRFGTDWLKPLREGISGMAKGQGDYAVGSKRKDSARLWFWWQP